MQCKILILFNKFVAEEAKAYTAYTTKKKKKIFEIFQKFFSKYFELRHLNYDFYQRDLSESFFYNRSYQ